MDPDHNFSLTRDSLNYLGEQVDVKNLKPEYKPGPETISGTAADRKKNLFTLAEKLWKLTPENWLAMEKAWLQSARAKSGSNLTEGKDKVEDVISTEILIRILAATLLACDPDVPEVVKDEAVLATNLVLGEAVAKGRTRLTKTADGASIYTILKSFGVMIGTGGGKYLPDPEESLPKLFSLLTKSKINPEAYL